MLLWWWWWCMAVMQSHLYSSDCSMSSCFRTFVWLVSRISPARNISSTTVYTWEREIEKDINEPHVCTTVWRILHLHANITNNEIIICTQSEIIINCLYPSRAGRYDMMDLKNDSLYAASTLITFTKFII